MIVLPFIGTLTHLVVHGRGMAEREHAAHAQFADYVKSVSGGVGEGAGSELQNAKQLLDSGAITQTEYEALTAKVLA